MAQYRKCDPSVAKMADELMAEYPESFISLVANKVRIDFMFAFAEKDETTGMPIGNALTAHGVRAIGIARKLPSKDRAKGLGDAEISLDGDWWGDASPGQQKALLDHEMYHLVATDKRDDLGRPLLKLRKHDFQFGWFTSVAHRHGVHSMERSQAKSILEISGQYYFPELIAHAGTTEQAVRQSRTVRTSA